MTDSVSDGLGRKTGGVARPSDVFIALMGITGSGKSTFISLCTEQEVEIGHDMESCTKDVAVYAYEYSPETTVYLVDTPGFDDSNRTDTEVLKEIAGWMTDTYSNDIKLNGIIYLHRITDPRMQGTAKRNLFIFKKLCGKDALKNILLATTMWELVDPEKGAKREQQLVDTPDFWGWMKDNGSQIHRHNNNRESALALIEIFASQNSKKAKVVLELQSQMVDKGKTLDETDAGIQLDTEMAKEREKVLKEMEALKLDMLEAQEARDKESALMLEDQRREMDEKLSRMDRERENLKTNMEKLHQERYSRMEEKLEETRKENERVRKALEADALRQAEAHQKQLDAAEKARKALETRWRREADEREAKLRREMEEERTRQDKAARQREEDAAERLKKLTLEAKPKVRSHPGKNRIKENVAFTVAGTLYYFCGPAMHYSRSPSSLPEDRGGNRYVAFGEDSSWYRHYHINGKCWTQRSGNLETEYPDLEKWISKEKAYGCPTCVSLGPDGRYFIRTSKGAAWRLPSLIQDDVGPIKNVESLWLGHGTNYICQRFDGSKTWRLGENSYGGLAKWIKAGVAGTTKLKAVALDIEDNTAAIVAWVNGSLYKHGGDSFEAFEAEEWGTTNLGLTF